jgi:N-dimethylarginine dimethylaminohydrolase
MNSMGVTHHSEYGRLRSVFLKRPEHAFVSDEELSRQWKNLNFLSKPQFSSAIQEYHKFEQLLKPHETSSLYLPEDPSVTIDSIYVRDAALATDYGMIICNMGKPARRNEPAAQQREFEKQGIPVLGTIQSPGTLEGGDVAWIDKTTLAVGHTYRTNEEGIHQLRQLLEPKGITIWVASMPHYKGSSDVFHLMSVFSPVDKDLAVVYSALMPIAFRNGLLDRGYSFIEVPDSEWDSMGCNVLAIAPRECVMVAGNPATRQQLLNARCIVHEYQGQEISVKGGGGPTCLTRPLLREI